MSGGPFLEADEHLELQGLIDDTMSGWDSCMLDEYVNWDVYYRVGNENYL